MGRGQSPAPAIPMSTHQREMLLSLVGKHSLGQQLAKRIRILLLAAEGYSNSEVKRSVGVALNTVKSRRKRWLSHYDDLIESERLLQQGLISASDYQSTLMLVIEDNARSGAPKIITFTEEQQIVALSSDHPCNHGVEMGRWTHQMLAKVAVAKGIVNSVSPAQVGRILKKPPASTS